MRAIQFVAPGRPEFVDVPIPAAGPGCALVRPLLLSLCGSDVRSAYYAPADDYPQPVGRGGHEVIARVETLDAATDGIAVGDLVLALVPGDTGMAEYFCTANDNLLPLPAGLPPEQLLMAQQLGTVIHACKRLPNLVGRDVAVIGQGSAGLFFDAMLRRMGAARIMAIDVVEARVAVAAEFGATHLLNSLEVEPVAAIEAITAGRMADLVVEAVGEPDSINLMPKLVREGGYLLSFGILRGPHVIAFDYFSLFRKKCLLTSSDGTITEAGRTSTRMALDLIASGQIGVGSLLTHRFPFSRVEQAYELARSRADGVIKIVIDMLA
jgi:threonine dehydrogenase-like Zn-dependent dehydrogenase